MKHIVLTGYMGVGKTTLGKQLSAHYGLPFYDTDDALVEGEGQSINDLIFNSEGYFRTLETAYVQLALKKNIPSIIALGGGAFCNPETYKCIQEAHVLTIYLNMSDETCLKQLEQIKSSRPLLNTMQGEQWKIQALNLYQKRRPLYERAHVQIDREGLTIEDLIQRIEKQYGKIF